MIDVIIIFLVLMVLNWFQWGISGCYWKTFWLWKQNKTRTDIVDRSQLMKVNGFSSSTEFYLQIKQKVQKK